MVTVSYTHLDVYKRQDIDVIDYQILVEADFLVNFYEDNLGKNIIETTLQKIFQTESGKTLCRLCYFGH